MAKRRFWTENELAFLKVHFPDTNTQEIADQFGCTYSRVANKANSLGLKKSDVFKSDLTKNGHANLLIYGKKTRFQKGQEPMNKGKNQTDYMSAEAIERTKATRFGKGSTPHNTKEDGAISIRNTKGRPYQWIRIALSKWELLHRVIWVQHYGEIQKGMIVAFKDGNSLNCDIDNLELVSRGQNMNRNTIHRYPPEVKAAIKQLSKLKKVINHAEK